MDEEEQFQRKLSCRGALTARIGALTALGTVVLLWAVAQVGRLPEGTDPSLPFVLRHISTLTVGTFVLQGVCGVLLVVWAV